MKNKLFWIALILLLITTSSGFARQTKAGQHPPLDPYTEIQLPLEDLPALNKDLVYHPVLDIKTLSMVDEEYDSYEQSGPQVQILSVLKDPREVPLARYAANTDHGVLLPDEDLVHQDLITINVYLRTTGPEIREDHHPLAPDPILTSEHAELRWPALYVAPLSFEQAGISRYPCAPVEYADGTSPYPLPGEINGGDAVGEDGLYDPAAYAPPKPWYYHEDPLLGPGDVQEGWVSCLAPDVPLEQLQVYYRNTYLPTPEIAFVEQARPTGDPYPAQSELEEIGLSNSTQPQTNAECAEMDDCINVARISLDNCRQAAFEAELEQGICAEYDFYNSLVDYEESESYEEGEPYDMERIIAESEITWVRVFYTTKTSEEQGNAHKSYLLWNYTVANSYPVSLIKLEDIILTFVDVNDHDNTIKDTGAVTFYDPRIDQNPSGVYDAFLGCTPGANIYCAHEYALFSRVVVQPDNLSRQDVDGYRLSTIGARIDTLVEKEGILISGRNKGLGVNDYFVQPSDPFEGIIYVGIGEEIDLSWNIPHTAYGSLNPGTALIGLFPIQEEISKGRPRISFHPVRVSNTFGQNLVAETNMCDVVDCLEISDPRYENMPPRTVPVMCAGEWANNFVVDGVELVPEMYYIGEAWGLGPIPDFLHKDYEEWKENIKVLLYDGRVMGGAAPWWVYSRSYPKGLYGMIFGNVVDLETGIYLHDDAYVVHYYGRVNQNDLSQGYFSVGGDYYAPATLAFNMGWMGDIADQKILIFGTISPYEDSGYEVLTDSNTGFIFQDEGPIWVSGCSRPVISTLANQESYSETSPDVSSGEKRDEHVMTELLQGMGYPQSLPVVTEEVIPLGEYSTPVSYGNYRIATKQVNIVPGKPDAPTVYVESKDKYYPAERFPSFNNEIFFARNGGVVIPPDTSLVRVKIALDYIANEHNPLTGCSLKHNSFELAYPGYLPIQGIGDRKFPERWPCDNQDYSTWVTFLFPSLDIELDKMLLSVYTNGRDPWLFLRLTDN